MTDRLQALWTTEGRDAQPLTPEAARIRVQTLDRRARLLDMVEYVAAAAVVVIFAIYWANAANDVIASGCALVILGTVAVVAGLWKRRSLPAPNTLIDPQADHLRKQLVRRRDALASVASWYLAPSVPGLAVFAAGHWVDQAAWVGTASATIITLASLTVIALCFAVIWCLNRRAAAEYDKEIEALNRAFEIY